MANPLGSLPASTSPRFTLDKTDVLKVVRFLMMQGAGLLISEAPKLMGMTYVYKGVDYTPDVLIVVSAAAELARRFLAGAPKD